MGSRRLGRKRLVSLEKRGEKLTASQIGVGAGMEPALLRATRMRDGIFNVVEMVFDLGTSAAAIESYAANDVIGVDGADGTIFTWDIDINGHLVDLEMLILESPTTGDDDIHLYANNSAINANAAGNGGTDTTIDIGTAVVGESQSVAVTAPTYATAKFFYLVSDGSTAGTYDNGILVIRTTGFVLDTAAADTFV